MQLIDLSQEIFPGMPVYKGIPEVRITTHSWHPHEPGQEASPKVSLLALSEHTGTHVDALSHMSADHQRESIENMPLSTFYTEGICLDLSHKGLRELIQPDDLATACRVANQTIIHGDTVLIYTDHYRKHFAGPDWLNGPGLSAEATRWLGERKIAAFGVETMAPGVSGLSNQEVHAICGQLAFTHYENLVNLHLLVGRGRFRFIGFPLKIRGGTGSPVRAVAVVE
ncbi:MAG: cyclase family protein [Cyclobacteriaceae bacterium]|nr:cyclase family protein [Cyclobacteriaceae bacterium]